MPISRISIVAAALLLGLLILESPGFGADSKKAAAKNAEKGAEKAAEKAAEPKKEEKPVGGTCKAEKDTKSLIKKDIKVGKGAAATKMATVKVHYTGCLTNATKFDSSLDRGEPFSFVLGRGDVIKGWDEGVAGMKVGGKRRLIIPAEMGYGASGAGGVIPPNATLVFDVELLDVVASK